MLKQQIVENGLSIYPLGQDIWHCDSQNSGKTYRIALKNGFLTCTCPARGDCKHLKFFRENQPKADRRTTDNVAAQLVQEIVTLKAQVKDMMSLGFEDDRTFIYIGHKDGGLWYLQDADGSPEAIKAPSLKCIIKAIDFEPDPAGFGHKMLVTVFAKQTYTLRTGHDTQFAKGLLVAIASMTPDQLQRPLKITPKPGHSGGAVSCEVMQDGAIVPNLFDERTNMRAIVIRARMNLGTKP